MPDAVHVGSGKVRELYALDDERLLLVASDRISTFDVVLPTEIPDKGRVLTGLSGFWFRLLRGIVPNHMLAIREDGRSMECRRLEIFTPATKAQTGHDENITREQAAELVGGSRLREVEEVAIELYRVAAEHAWGAGIIIADTKFEFGLDPHGHLVLGDEALTPDSSRFWPGESYEPGRAQDSFDKQFVRDYCETLGWDKAYPGPELPADVVQATRAKYVEAFERLTTIPFDAYLESPSVVLG